MKQHLLQSLLTLTLMMLGAANVGAQNRVELEDAMFKAWDSWQADAQPVENPEKVDGSSAR